MHVIIGFLTSLVTIFYLLDRLGIDIGGFNPFYIYRRISYQKKYGSDPIYSIEDPVHVAALLVIGVAKLDGEITAEQKKLANELFQSKFSMDSQEASSLFGSAAHLLASPQLIEEQLGKLAKSSEKRFSPEQARSLVQMMRKVANASASASDRQTKLIDEIESKIIRKEPSKGAWS